MRYINGLLVGFLVFSGFLVGFVSLYFSSLSGVMNRLGFVGGDLTREVRVNDLVRGLRDIPDKPSCDFWGAIAPVPSYLFARGEQRIVLGFTLGYDRVVCGTHYIISGNAERGIYTILKGIYYLRSSYLELGKSIPQSPALCMLRGGDTVDPWVAAYLSASRGTAHDVIYNAWREVFEDRAHVAELCNVIRKNAVDGASLTF